MRITRPSTLLFLVVGWGLLLLSSKTTLAQLAVNYTHAGDLLQGFIFFPDYGVIGEEAINDGQVPVVVVVPDSDGIGEYELMRASMISQDWKYVAFVADIYGFGKQNITDVDERETLSTTWTSNATFFAERIQTAVNTAIQTWGIPVQRVGLTGYGLGGTGVLAHAMVGWDTVDAVVAFHGDGLDLLPSPSTTVTPKILVLSGSEDDSSKTIMDLEETLNSVNATWEITRLSGVGGAFTDVGNEAFDDWADYRAWVSAQNFFREALSTNGSSFYASPYQPGFTEDPTPPDAPNVKVTLYNDDDGTQLKGYLAEPDDTVYVSPHPAIIILPDWDGVNEYEQLRATKLSQLGYVAFAADIYGADLQQNLTFDQRSELSSTYRDNATLFVQRIERAIEIVQNLENVDADNLAVIGYCFGGTGVIQLAFSGNSDAKVVVSFHGGLTELPPVTTSVIPYTLILSGGDDDAHGNQTELEAALDAANATWEITRYSGVGHGFTDWSSDAYAFMADSRSWDSMYGTVFEKLSGPDLVVPTTSPSDFPSMVPTPTIPTTSFSTTNDPVTMMPTPFTALSDVPSSLPTVMPAPTPSDGGTFDAPDSTSGASLASGPNIAALLLSAALAIVMMS